MTLLPDALARTLREPQCAQRWHRLMAVWAETGDHATRQQVLNALRSVTDSDARAAIMRLTFLAEASGDLRFEDAAAVQVLAARPADPDRLATFMAYRWLSALQNIEGRAAFIADLHAGQMPTMAALLAGSASKEIPPEFLPRVPKEFQRIAVVVPYIGHQFHTPSMMAVEQCSILAHEGRQVHIFSAQELMPPDASLFRGDGRKLVLPPLNTKVWAGILPVGVNMTISDSRFSLPGRWRNLMPKLARFDPDVVLLVGLYSPLAAALYSVRPIVGISVNSVAPIAPLDVCLGADPAEEHREAWGDVFPPPRTLYHPYRVKRSSKNWAVRRYDFGIDEKAVIWITAGFRLEREIRGEWARRILQLMSRHPNVVWLLVGGEGRLPPALQQGAQGRIRPLPTRNDLPGILRICDIYVNPPRMGGGFSVAEAMAEGMPVVAFAGSDGGDKVGALALPDVAAYMDYLTALTENQGMRGDTGQALRRRFDELLDIDASGPALLEACRSAAGLAGKRLKGPS